MPSAHGRRFTVDRLPEVDQQIRELASEAKVRGFSREYIRALKSIVDELERDPLGWGDPQYHAKSQGSTVCHGVLGPLYVEYVVFEPDSVVVILGLRPMPSAGLD